jgi:hypothetical protein
LRVISSRLPGVVGRAWHGPSSDERRPSELLDMQGLFWLTIAYRFGDEAMRLLDLEDSSQHDWVGFAATELLLVVGED